ncbi:MAG: Fe-S-containing hydro-lyase [Fusobacteriota bacterium]
MKTIRLQTPLKNEDIKNLKSGDKVLLNGIIYTARDEAHKKIMNSIKLGKNIPFDLKGAVIYYVGPAPAKKGEVIGSAGPTTSYRMDSFSPKLIKLGLKGMIGKGKRDSSVIEACKKNKAIYFGATGGAAALISNRIKSSEIIAYRELGPEAVRKLYVEDFPLVVINDTYGNDLYEEGKKKWKK